MAKMGNMLEIDPEKEYKNKCKDGKCSQCGDCCSDLLPITVDEINAIKKFMAAHPVKEHKHRYPTMQDQYADFTCPFRNDAEKKCDIYEVRPVICRRFICSKSLRDATADRDIVSKDRVTRSMREVFFGDTTIKNMLDDINQMIANLISWGGY